MIDCRMLQVGRTSVTLEQDFLKVRYILVNSLGWDCQAPYLCLTFLSHPVKCTLSYVAVWENLTLIPSALKVENR